jgi:hypothetical protein
VKLKAPLVFDSGPLWRAGAGSPEGVVAAPIGSLYSRTDGGADTAVYRKETGSGNTGWVPVADVYVNASAPAGTPNTGDLWWDSDEVAMGTTLPLGVVNGGTGATSAATARASLAVPGIGNSTTTAGAPTTGTWARGDQWLDSAGVVWTCVTAGTPGVWSAPPGTELVFVQSVTAVTVTASTYATAQLVVDAGTRTYDGSPIIIEFYSPCVQTAGVASCGTIIDLWDGGTELGALADVYSGNTSGQVAGPVFARRRITPSAGSHNYRIGAWVQGGTGYVWAAAVTTGSTFGPMYVRIIRA